jgi:endonuclease-3
VACCLLTLFRSTAFTVKPPPIRSFVSSFGRKMPPFTRSVSSLQSSLDEDGRSAILATDSVAWSSMTVAQLKEKLKERNLPVSGVKAVLIDRLQANGKEAAKIPTKRSSTKSKPATKTATKTPTKTKRGSPTKTKSPSKSPRSPKREKIVPGSLDPPPNWERIYSLVEELRSDRSAPVDTDGGEALPEKHLGEKVYRFQVLTALMLSSQTKDAVVGETMRILQRHGLTVENIHQTDHETLNGLIKKVGFHNNKTKFMKQAAEIILTEYNGDIPPNADEMMKLPGVGPKMAYIVENIAFDKASGIGVDTHMHRMFNDLKWVTSKTPEGTREQLEGWLPRNKWSEINYLWVGFGQEVQQQQEKMLRKCLDCSSPSEALKLVKKLRLDVKKEAKKFGLEDDVKKALS